VGSFLRRTGSAGLAVMRSGIACSLAVRAKPLAAILLAITLALTASCAIAAEEQKKPDAEAVFELREASAFKALGAPPMRGQFGRLEERPNPAVRAYPKLQSARPRYGRVRFGLAELDQCTGPEYCFVLDESGGTGKGYDRLYFDANADGNLTNDPVLRPMTEPDAKFPHWTETQILFDPLTLDFDHGPALGKRPFRILPRCLVDKDKLISIQFVAPQCREGRIQIGPEQYDAVLSQPYLVFGRFDAPLTYLTLRPVGASKPPTAWDQSEYLGALQHVGGRFYTLSAAPLGDKLTVRPYTGPFGVFRVAPGQRKIDESQISFRGILGSRTMAFPVGTFSGSAKTGTRLEPVRECLVAVGDYIPGYSSLQFGRLEMSISENYHSEGRRRDRTGRPLQYAVQIRQDKPYVLDFSSTPEVVFTEPARDAAFKPGDEVAVAAVLVDPVLDIMIRRLWDTTRKEKITHKFADGKEHSYERSLSLDPVVTVKSSSGKEVSSGKMPFG